ncbi:MAG: hypothetical protein ABIK93_02570 [candidate division WOR-3 bacterium]
MEKYCNNQPLHRLTQHKRFIPNGIHPNSAFGGTSFMPDTVLCAILAVQKMMAFYQKVERDLLVMV